MTLLAAGILQRFGDLLVAAIVLGFAAFGAGSGVFVAVLVGLDALASIVVALAFAKPLAAVLVSMEVPEKFAFAAAFGGLLVGTATALRLAIGRWVPPDVVRFAPLIDQFGGGLVGAVAGMIVAGSLLVAASILPLPQALAIDGTKLSFDMGTRVLRTFTRCVERKDEARSLLLDGEPPAAAATGLLCSELFADTNRNGRYDGEDAVKERYIDADRNGLFTPQLPFADSNNNGKRDVGLLERYRLATWDGAIVMHSPVISSPDSAAVADDAEDGAAVYQAAANDLDPGDTLVFGLRPAAAADGNAAAQEREDDLLVEIDPATGVVTLFDAEEFASLKIPYRFVVTVTDSRGLKDEKAVSLRRSPPKPGGKRKPKPESPAAGEGARTPGE
jgi:uncharacterized membrane protein required for colicin V production